jgi:hypothetical protein
MLMVQHLLFSMSLQSALLALLLGFVAWLRTTDERDERRAHGVPPLSLGGSRSATACGERMC